MEDSTFIKREILYIKIIQDTAIVVETAYTLTTKSPK